MGSEPLLSLKNCMGQFCIIDAGYVLEHWKTNTKFDMQSEASLISYRRRLE
jgi:hypothetical protein